MNQDPRHIITPDAFTVDKSLLGLPLATPKKRAVAMVIDLIIIQQLSHVGTMVMGLSTVILLYLLSRSKGRKTVGSSRTSVFKVLALLLFVFVIGSEYWQYRESHEFSFFNEKSVVSEDVQDSQELAAVESNNLPLEQQLTMAQSSVRELSKENRVLRADDDSDFMDILEALGRKFGYGFGWAGLYFTLCVYLLAGQTPGKWLMRIKIIQLDGKKISVWNAFGRYGGYAASVVTGLSGFFQIYWDANRQGLHDKVASTVVVNV